MLEESVTTVWAYINSWFTPTLLFVILNIMIGTIAIVSGIGTQKHHHQEQKEHPQLARAPSVLQRLKSINLYRFRSQELDPFPSITAIFQSPELGGNRQTLEPSHDEQNEIVDENPNAISEDRVTRKKSDRKTVCGDVEVNLQRKMKKRSSSKLGFEHFEKGKMVERRPSTVKEGKSKANELQTFGDDEGVDAKADDFINRFKQQLKLQRLDSIMRYKEMLGRGGK